MNVSLKNKGVGGGSVSNRSLGEGEPVLLEVESRVRGFRNARAFRRWCRSRSIPLVKDGKMLWVVPADINREVEKMKGKVGKPIPAAPVEVLDEVSEALMKKIGRKV